MEKKYLLLLFPVMLTGCGNDESVECSSPISTQILTNALKKSALEQISGDLTNVESITNGAERSSLEKVVFNISDVVTVNKDPNSTLRTCSATVSVQYPAADYQEASSFYSEDYSKNLDKTMESFSLEQNGNTFKTQVSYTVQPTDDKKTVFVNLSGNNGAVSGASLLTELKLLKPVIEQQKIEAAKKQQDMLLIQKQLEQQQQQQQPQAQSSQPAPSAAADQNMQQQQPTESVTSARDRFLAADQDLGKTWHNLGIDKQRNMLNEQRQWIKNKDAICGKIAMKGSDADIIKMFQCQYEMTQKRGYELKQAM